MKENTVAQRAKKAIGKNRLIFPSRKQRYTLKHLRSDALAGLSVGIMLVPQGMAYALLAGMPPQYGLYASVVPLVIYALLGESRHLAFGTTAIDSMILLTAVSAFAVAESTDYVQIALLFTCIVGVIHVLFALGRLGFLSNLLSRAVLLGFVSAAATIIGASQLGNLLGVSLPRTEFVHIILKSALENLSQIHLPTLGFGLMGIAMLVFFRIWNKLFPAVLVVVVVGTLLAWLMHLDNSGVNIVGNIPTGLPQFGIPEFDLSIASKLILPAFMLAIIQFSNVISLDKSFANKHNYTIRANRELFALGAANIIGSFFQSFASSGSFSRTALNEQVGARTAMSNAFAAALIILALLVLTPVLYYLPVPILAAIIMVAAFGMIDFAAFLRLYRIKRSDGLVAWTTFIVTLIAGLQIGILFGIAASVVAIMYRISNPNVAILGNLPGTRSYRDISVTEEAQEVPGVLILRIDASFNYANAEFLREMILSKCNDPETEIEAVVIDASSVNDLDTTAVGILYTVIEKLESKGIDLYFTGVHGSTVAVMNRSGLFERLGPDRFFLSPHRAISFIKSDHPISGEPDESNKGFYKHAGQPPSPVGK